MTKKAIVLSGTIWIPNIVVLNSSIEIIWINLGCVAVMIILLWDSIMCVDVFWVFDRLL